MAKRSVNLRLADLIEAAERVREVLGDLSLEDFEADWQRHWLVQRGIEIISEASRHFPAQQTCQATCDGGLKPNLVVGRRHE